MKQERWEWGGEVKLWISRLQENEGLAPALYTRGARSDPISVWSTNTVVSVPTSGAMFQMPLQCDSGVCAKSVSALEEQSLGLGTTPGVTKQCHAAPSFRNAPESATISAPRTLRLGLIKNYLELALLWHMFNNAREN
jgi:hypothetical protein